MAPGDLCVPKNLSRQGKDLPAAQPEALVAEGLVVLSSGEEFQKEQVLTAYGKVYTKAGAIDVLVNSAGIAYVAVMEEIKMEHLRWQMETNFFGAVRVTQAVLPAMRERRRGRIIHVSSVAGKMSMPLFGPYSASKFALEGMSDALRLELYPFGIHVVLLEPAYIRTNMEGASVELSADYAGRAESSPYRGHYQAFRRVWKARTKDSKATPEDFVQVLQRALRETPPRPRYPVTRRAAMVNYLKRLMSDRALDRQMLRIFALEAVSESSETRRLHDR